MIVRPASVLNLPTAAVWRRKGDLYASFAVVSLLQIPALMLLALVGYLALQTDVPASSFMRDPTAIAGMSPFEGLISNIGAILWALTMGVTLFTAMVLQRSGMRGSWPAFFGYFGCLTAILLLDDVFLIHDEVIPSAYSVAEQPVYALYGSMLLYGLVRYRSHLWQHGMPLFLMASACFSISVGFDVFVGAVEGWKYWVEDGTKLLGICNWCLCFTGIASQVLLSQTRRGAARGERSLKAVLVAHNGGLYGAERSLLSLARGMSASPDCRILVLVPHEGDLAAQCRAYHIDVRVAGYRQWVSGRHRWLGVVKRGLCNLVAGWRVMPRIWRFAPDVIYTGTGTTPFGAILARQLGVPHVWHLREFGSRDYGLSYDLGSRRSWRYIAAHADRLVANAEAVKAYFAPRLQRSDIDVIYNGFEFPDATPLSGEQAYQRCVVQARPPELLLLGALTQGKGQHDAIEAVAELLRRDCPVRLTLAGEGEPEYIDALQALAHRRGVQDSVAFAGFIHDSDRLYRRAALTLVCSRSEGFGRTAVESLGSGTPVVGTQAGGLPEIVQPGHTGLLYPPGDWRALAECVQALLTDRTLYTRIADQAREQVRRRFAVSRYVREMSGLLRTVAGQARATVMPGEFVPEPNR